MKNIARKALFAGAIALASFNVNATDANIADDTFAGFTGDQIRILFQTSDAEIAQVVTSAQNRGDSSDVGAALDLDDAIQGVADDRGAAQFNTFHASIAAAIPNGGNAGEFVDATNGPRAIAAIANGEQRSLTQVEDDMRALMFRMVTLGITNGPRAASINLLNGSDETNVTDMELADAILSFAVAGVAI